MGLAVWCVPAPSSACRGYRGKVRGRGRVGVGVRLRLRV